MTNISVANSTHDHRLNLMRLLNLAGDNASTENHRATRYSSTNTKTTSKSKEKHAGNPSAQRWRRGGMKKKEGSRHVVYRVWMANKPASSFV